MAQNLLCDLCQNEPAELMQTNVANGDAITVGASCMLVFLLTTADSILESMPADTAQLYGTTLAPIVARLTGLAEATTATDTIAAAEAEPTAGAAAPARVAVADGVTTGLPAAETAPKRAQAGA